MDHAQYMRLALAEAEKAFAAGEVPIGAVVVRNGEVLARAHNRRETLSDPTAHAEILAMREAGAKLRTWRLHDATLYVTLEPCPMCAGAMVQARIDQLVFAAADPKGGGVVSVLEIVQEPRFNHRVKVVPGILADEAAALLKEFFRQRR